MTPTAKLGLLQDANAKNEDGPCKFPELPTLEIQHAQRVFKPIPHVFELPGAKRFNIGDPLIDLLACTRAGKRLPPLVWQAFQRRCATDSDGILDPPTQI